MIRTMPACVREADRFSQQPGQVGTGPDRLRSAFVGNIPMYARRN